MTKDTHEYATDLAGVYRDWLHSRHLLQQTIETLSNLKPAQVEVVLENAVMHRLLHSVGPKVPELFAEVDREALAHGFEAIEHAATDKDYDAILAIIGQAWPTEPPTEVPNPRLTDEALVVGAFTQPLVTPVKRLIEEAMSHYEESVALDYVARCALRYASIYAKTRHIGPPKASTMIFTHGAFATRVLHLHSMRGSSVRRAVNSSPHLKTPTVSSAARGASSKPIAETIPVPGALILHFSRRRCNAP